ncbi:UDP-glucose/GDP-mannose dehydrogenase family protein [Alloacidobacterium dinghuense]|uniref:UDP-glucose 6-dehydrogenase n=1 Tax=Alloacidobacterium dinghuense TaxID=2763107 RepID=A0A7G8BLS6_9BACT|nr:UDP-glucose/GDP-mannose dehydrogenase family protein [Alloacidobacterium dinghuense]QNI33496.1 UDP-glucose/GDP-mannose dehydrogenase family protein [Alloacidobacterium dinghuense]
MKVSVFGLGYVGTVCAGCLAAEGHDVAGVDPVQIKVDFINQGHSPIVEPEIDGIIARHAKTGRIRATTDPIQAVIESELSFVCVGTPSQANGNLDLRFIRRICEQIGEALRTKDAYHTVVIRSTILPGTMHKVVIPTLEEFSGKKSGRDFGVCNNPEFLREGTAVADFRQPPKTVIGEMDTRSGDLVASLYEAIPGPLVRTDLRTAEMIKYVDNCWHALKIGFANEIGNLCDASEIDAQKVMDIFCEDRKLNISPAYLRPGFAFGGSCLPKDLRALSYHARLHDLQLPILNSVLPSNEIQIMRGLKLVMESENSRIGILGFSFKAGTDDLRESPMIEVIERLIGKGYDLRIYDRNVNIAALTGANREFILKRIPHISRLMVPRIEDVLAWAQTIVIGNSDPEFKQAPQKLRVDQCLIDFVRITTPERKYAPSSLAYA